MFSGFSPTVECIANVSAGKFKMEKKGPGSSAGLQNEQKHGRRLLSRNHNLK